MPQDYFPRVLFKFFMVIGSINFALSCAPKRRPDSEGQVKTFVSSKSVLVPWTSMPGEVIDFKKLNEKPWKYYLNDFSRKANKYKNKLCWYYYDGKINNNDFYTPLSQGELVNSAAVSNKKLLNFFKNSSNPKLKNLYAQIIANSKQADVKPEQYVGTAFVPGINSFLNVLIDRKGK